MYETLLQEDEAMAKELGVEFTEDRKRYMNVFYRRKMNGWKKETGLVLMELKSINPKYLTENQKIRLDRLERSRMMELEVGPIRETIIYD